MEFVFNETSSKIQKRIEAIVEPYKANVNLTINDGKIENLNGNVVRTDATDPYAMGGITFHAYKRDDTWYTNVDGVSNEEHDVVTDFVVAVVDKAVADYEVA